MNIGSIILVLLSAKHRIFDMAKLFAMVEKEEVRNNSVVETIVFVRDGLVVLF